MQNSNLRKSFKNFSFYVVILIFTFFSINFASASAASLYLSPSIGNYTVGNTFSVQAKVNSGGTAVNAADGTLIFDPDKLEVTGISKDGSVFSLWVQEPDFSNSLGTINFAGGKPSPGFSGAAGTMITITFKARVSGTANIAFASGSVLADDGKGTNILANMGSGIYNLAGREVAPLAPEETPPAVEQTPDFPIISSPSHPEENKWYANNDPEFSWKLPQDVVGVSLVFNDKPETDPGAVSDGEMESKKYEGIEDGIWYFHIKFKNKYGWGKVTHRKILIDTVPPKPFRVDFQSENLTDPSPVLFFKAEDELRGIDYYKIKIGEGDSFSVNAVDAKSAPYKLPVQAPGKHVIEIKAFDKAGNYASFRTEVDVLPIETPVINEFPRRLFLSENLNIAGKSLPEAVISIFVQKKGQEPTVDKTYADVAGDFTFISPETLKEGDYELWVQARDKRGALSLPSRKIRFTVGLPPVLKFGKVAIDYLTVMITLLVLIIGALALIFYGWYRISIWRKRLRTETKEASRGVSKAFRALRKEVQKQIEYLDGKPGLNKEEENVREKLKEAIDDSEEFISEEIKDIEKKLK